MGLSTARPKAGLSTHGTSVSLRCAIALALGTLAYSPGNILAQESVVEEIITIGTRAAGRISDDLPVAVDTLSAEEMAETGQTEVGRMLQSLAPSFNFSSSLFPMVRTP